ncbi:helix-turn-helix domain-containing protein [Piscinibacter sp. XHJ-5]|uniref:winged helix-turn-helix transcriptional regulator n=1 Tax=Piscinibacter sp. XHJ-5 TaxID=3037797 RepID=UPI00245358EE|nr:helix-turn-helix domain-containing protein [Piscinibacter sp. XHJ-5]
METTVASTIVGTKKAPAGNGPRVARANAVSGCALTAALAALGGRWKLFIVYRLSDGPMHFAALRRSLPEMSAKVLAQQLREMQADGLLDREPRGRVPAPVIYALTPHGRSLLPVAEAIRRWGMAHQDFRACEGTPDIAADPRAVCGAGIETQ